MAPSCLQYNLGVQLNLSLAAIQKEDQTLVFHTNYRLMQVKNIAECSNGSILQYFRPSLSKRLSVRSLFCLFLSGRLRQVLLYLNLYPPLYRLENKFVKVLNYY